MTFVEDQLASIARSLPDAVLVIGTVGDVVWANQSAEDLFGLALADSIGLNGLDLVHPDDQVLVLMSLDSVQDKTVGTAIEVRVRTADGWRLVEIVGRPFGDQQVLLCLRDLTQRRRWEVTHNDTELARALIENAASVTLLVDLDGIVASCSGGVTRMLGLDTDLVEGAPMTNLVAAEDHDRLGEAFALARPGEAATVEARLVRGDATLVPFALTLVDLRDDPTVEGWVVSGHEITDRVRAEHDLRGALSLLEATFDSTAEGLLVVDNRGSITGFNRRFVDMWELPQDILESRDDDAAIGYVLSQLHDPDAFITKIQELYSTLEAESHDTLHFIDGRVVDRFSYPQRVDGAVVGRVWSFSDVTANVRLQDELKHQAFHDALTGLANQSLFRDRVEHAAARIARAGGRLAVLFVDLDDFKTINDSLGHAAGDDLLVAVSKRLRECLRTIDTAARLGGDEFAILVEDADDERVALQIADRVIGSLQRPIVLSGREVVVSASVGIAYGAPGSNAEDLLRNADLAMYTAKAQGKRCFRIFAPAMHHAALERLEAEATLRGAAERGELVVHYQPIFDLWSGRIEGFEALVRWQHPTRGLLAPGAFIPFAEQTGLIDEIGRHVLMTACAEAASWPADGVGHDAPAISVNLAPRQLLDPRLPSWIRASIELVGLAPERLILEITEGALMADPFAAISSLEALDRMGVRLAVDDFGTGYSSLAYLQQFPIDILKIDRAFVSNLTSDPSSSLASAIVQLTRTLGLTPLAEGIETEEQAEVLRTLGCSLAQGFHLGRPIDAAATRSLLAQRSGRPEPAR